MMRLVVVLSVFVLPIFAAPVALAGFDKLFDPNCSDESDCSYWIPKLPALKGWHVDEKDSKDTRSRTLVPDGAAASGPAIYARAIRKIDLTPTAQSIAGVMTKEREEAEMMYPGSTFADGPALRSGDKKAVRTQTSVPPKDGEFPRWRRYAYLQEGTYFITFELSATSQAELDALMKDFEQLVASYKAKLRGK